MSEHWAFPRFLHAVQYSSRTLYLDDHKQWLSLSKLNHIKKEVLKQIAGRETHTQREHKVLPIVAFASVFSPSMLGPSSNTVRYRKGYVVSYL